jgi:hypothetical protein
MRKPMVEVQCERCRRVEYRDQDKDIPSTFIARLADGDTTLFEIEMGDLCAPCLRTVAGHLEAITKSFKGKSPSRGAKKKGPDVKSVPQVDVVAAEKSSQPKTSD